jgi:hypothetical protein
MNTQDPNKSVSIINFSICGVGGFKTVIAANAGPEKRMFSAFNDMDRKFRMQEKELAATESDTPEYHSAQRVLQLIDIVKHQCMIERDVTVLKYDEKTFTMSTDQFFENTRNLYQSNIKNFLDKIGDIGAAVEKYAIASKKTTPTKTWTMGIAPDLWVCTGSLFGEKPFYAFMSRSIIAELGDGNPDKVIQHLTNRSLAMVKNFRLTDYLRYEGAKQESVKSDILFIDGLIDTLHDIKIVNVGPMVRPGSLSPKCSNSALEKVKSAITVMELESARRLDDYVLNLIAERNQQANVDIV